MALLPIKGAIERAPARGGRGLAAWRCFAGPTLIASVAYLDPGNFATNIASGARYGYRLLWVVLVANLMAMLFQALAAKLGIVHGRSLAVGAGIDCLQLDHRRRYIGKLRDGDDRQGDQPGQHDDDRDDDCQVRSVDEEIREHRLTGSRACLAAPASPPGRDAPSAGPRR